MLERGDVVIQFRPDVVSGASLGSLVSDRVVLMPNPALGPNIVLTAWAHKMECKGYIVGQDDESPIAEFISTRVDRGPSPHSG